jgi:hypothetical protein
MSAPTSSGGILHRPDIVKKAIILASAEEAVRQAPGTSLKLSDLLARSVPRFRVVSPDGGAAQQEPQYFRGRDAEDYVPAQW